MNQEDVIVVVHHDGYVSHGVGVETLRNFVFPHERFSPGWGGSRWCKEINAWVIPRQQKSASKTCRKSDASVF